MTSKIAALVVVTFLSACGARARPAAAPSEAARAAPEMTSQTDDDYVVGPFVTTHENGQAGVVTYYIVRN